MGILSRDGLSMAMDFGRFLVSALMMFKLLMVVTGSEKPVVVVTSGSMEPAFQRGDLLVIYRSEDPIRAGEIILFNLQGREIPIVHRVIKLHEEWDTGEVNILTKGDKNYVDDSFVYPRGQLGIKRENVVGRIVGLIPYVGWPSLFLDNHRIVQYTVLGTFLSVILFFG